MAYTASGPVSPVRMRITCSTSCTKILPSPILPQEVDHVLGAAVQFGMALLAPEALHFRHRQAGHVNVGQGLAHFIQLERLDHAGNLFHLYSSICMCNW
jgi:hypothetical protein